MRNPQTAQDLFQMSREDWVEGARLMARHLLETRRTITSEDVTLAWPLPKYLHPNTIGQIFKENSMFHAVGYTKAKRPTSNGRVIRIWTLSDEAERFMEEDCE